MPRTVNGDPDAAERNRIPAERSLLANSGQDDRIGLREEHQRIVDRVLPDSRS
jgi:hypothetical protein